MTIIHDEFEKADSRSGTMIKAEVHHKVKKSAYKIWVDSGDVIGIQQTSAQIIHHYTRSKSLIGKSVIGGLNSGFRNIAGFISEFLLLGFIDTTGAIILATYDWSRGT